MVGEGEETTASNVVSAVVVGKAVLMGETVGEGKLIAVGGMCVAAVVGEAAEMGAAVREGAVIKVGIAVDAAVEVLHREFVFVTQTDLGSMVEVAAVAAALWFEHFISFGFSG